MTPWGPRDWIAWAGSVKAFFSSHGSIVTKLVISNDREGEFFMAAIENPDKYGQAIDALANTLHGIPIMFTTRLPRERMLFECKPDKNAL